MITPRIRITSCYNHTGLYFYKSIKKKRNYLNRIIFYLLHLLINTNLNLKKKATHFNNGIFINKKNQFDVQKFILFSFFSNLKNLNKETFIFRQY